MKFSDPLASLNFLGGTFPVHMAMAVFSGYVWFFHIENINCENVTTSELLDIFSDVFWMFWAHVLYALFFLIKKSFSKTTDEGTYCKTLFSFFGIVVYLLAYMYLQFRSFKFKDERNKNF